MNDLIRSTTFGSAARVKFATEVSLFDRIFGGLVASIVLGLFVFFSLFTVWWCNILSVEPDLIIYPPPWPPNSELLPVIEDSEQSVVEFDKAEGQAFLESIEMSGTSIAELSQSNSPFSNGNQGLIGNGDGLGNGFERSLKSTVGMSRPKWTVVQVAPDLESYQRKLDFFAIEIGAVHKSSDEIWRIGKLSTEKVVTRSSRSAESRHWHFVNQRKRLREWDRQTIAQAGINLQDVLAVHFYPADLIIKMQQLIDARYQDRASDLNEVTFKIVGTPGNFRFEIEDAQF